MFLMRVSNIKGSFRFEPTIENFNKLVTQETFNLKWYKNFTVLRARFVYVIFWTSGYVNVTKIRDQSEISEVFEEFRTLTKISPFALARDIVSTL